MQNSSVQGEILPSPTEQRHTCLFYDSKEDLLELAAPFIAAGLALGELCLWITPDFLSNRDVKEALAQKMGNLNAFSESAQLEIVGYRNWYLPSGVFDGEKVFERFIQIIRKAKDCGFSGLRVTGDCSFFRNPQLKHLMADYERKAQETIPTLAMTALCTYASKDFDKIDVFTLGLSHDLSLSNQRGIWTVLKDNSRNN